MLLITNSCSCNLSLFVEVLYFDLAWYSVMKKTSLHHYICPSRFKKAAIRII